MAAIPDFKLNPVDYKRYTKTFKALDILSTKPYLAGTLGTFLGVSIYSDKSVPEGYVIVVYKDGKRELIKLNEQS